MSIRFVMPAHNAAPYIAEAIESILAQTVSDWSLTVVDDGSTDDTAAIAAAYAARDPRIRLRRMPAPSGSAYQPRRLAILEEAPEAPHRGSEPSAAPDRPHRPDRADTQMPAGSEPAAATDRAHRPYMPYTAYSRLPEAPGAPAPADPASPGAEILIAPLDADDTIPPDYLERLLALRANTGADIVYPTMCDMGSRTPLLPTPDALYERPHPGREMVQYTLDGWRIGANGGLIDRRLYLRTYAEVDDTLTYSCADELLTRQLLCRARRVALSRTPYYYRANPDSITRRPSPRLFDYLLNNLALAALLAPPAEGNPEPPAAPDRPYRAYTAYTPYPGCRRLYPSQPAPDRPYRAYTAYPRLPEAPGCSAPADLGAEELRLLRRQLFHGIFDAMRLLNRLSFARADREHALALISECRKALAGIGLPTDAGRSYLRLYALPTGAAKRLLRLADRLAPVAAPLRRALAAARREAAYRRGDAAARAGRPAPGTAEGALRARLYSAVSSTEAAPAPDRPHKPDGADMPRSAGTEGAPGQQGGPRGSAPELQRWEGSQGKQQGSQAEQQRWKEGVIMMLDGEIHHGGVTDRMRGILTAYAECRRRGIPFHIHWIHPFPLTDYYLPATFDWRITEEDICRDLRQARPVVVDDIPDRPARRRIRAALAAMPRQLHLYTNADYARGDYARLYREVFRPAPAVEREVAHHRRALGEGYWSATTRFLTLLGDFTDWLTQPLPPAEQQALMEKTGERILRLLDEIPAGARLLLTSDSKKFLDYARTLSPRIYTVDGPVSNIDLGDLGGPEASPAHDRPNGADGANMACSGCGRFPEADAGVRRAWLKTFVDQQLIMGAATVVRLRTGQMYPTGFPRFAAEIGGRPFLDIVF